MTIATTDSAGVSRLSVICTVRDEARHIAAALESSLVPGTGELIVVDDGSTDGTSEIVRAVAASDPRVRVIASGGLGRGPALDLAFRSTSAPLVMNIDADDVVHPEWTRLALQVMHERPDLAVVAASPRYFSQHESVDWRDLEETPPVRDVTGELAYFNPITHSSAVMRRDAVNGIGGYDSTRSTHFDYDLWIRLAAAGWRLGRIELPLVAKRIHAGQKFESRRRLAYLRASAVLQVRAIRVTRSGAAAWAWLGLRLLWGLLPGAVRIPVRRALTLRVRRR